MITEDERFIKIQEILAFSDIHPNDCIKINDLIIDLSKQNKQLQNQVEKLTGENNDLEERVIHQDNLIKQLQDKLDIRNKEKSRICNQVINYRDKGKRKAKEITNLLALYKKTKEENEYLNVSLMQKVKIINELQSVIDKAIEYIETHKRKDEFLELNEWGTRELLEILRSKE